MKAPSDTTSATPTPKASLWTLWLPLAIFGLFVALVGYNMARPAGNQVPSRFVGHPLPAFDLPPAAEGRPGLSRGDFTDGKPRLLNFFASWCVPCAVEAPQLARLAAAGAEVNGIALRDHRPELAAFLARNGNPYSRIGADDVSAVQLGIGSSGVPETFVIDGKGVIRYQHIGDIRPEDVPMLLARLKEAEQ